MKSGRMAVNTRIAPVINHHRSLRRLVGLWTVFSTLVLGACSFTTESHREINLAVEPVTVVDNEPFDSAAAWAEFEQELRSKYAYLDQAGPTSVDEQLSRSRLVALRTETKKAFRRVLHQTAVTFTDPHLIVGPFEDDDFNIIMTSADLDVAQNEGRYFIADVRAASAADIAGVRPGWQLVSADETPIAQAALLPFGEVLPTPSFRQLAYGATHAANGRRGSLERKLTFRLPDGALVDLDLPNPRRFAQLLTKAQPVTVNRIGPNDEVGLVRFNNSLGNNKTITAFDEAIRALSNTVALVVDLRNTPSGGNTEVGRSIIGHFVDETKPYQMHTIPFIEREYGVPRRFMEYVEPREPRYRQPVVVLHGRWTGSMGEGVVIGLDAAADVHTVGSNMGDLLGALWNIDLASSGARMDLGGEAMFHPNATPREDYVADSPLRSADRDKDGEDPALTKALKIISER